MQQESFQKRIFSEKSPIENCLFRTNFYSKNIFFLVFIWYFGKFIFLVVLAVTNFRIFLNIQLLDNNNILAGKNGNDNQPDLMAPSETLRNGNGREKITTTTTWPNSVWYFMMKPILFLFFFPHLYCSTNVPNVIFFYSLPFSFWIFSTVQ